jgi:hypothetical protein
MHTWTSSVVSPIFSLVEWRSILVTRGPSKSRPDFDECDDLTVPLFEKKVSLRMLSSNEVL